MSEARRAVLSVDEAAAALGVNKSTLYTNIRQGKVACRRIGGRVLVPASVVHGDPPRGGAGGAAPRRGEEYLEAVREDLLRLFEGAPEDGSCGIDVTFRGGEICRTSVRTETARGEGPWKRR